MALNANQRDIKRAQKESHLMREISNLILKITLDEPALANLFVSRVKLSPDKSIAYVYMTAPTPEEFETKRPTLVLYKPSIRSSLAQILDSRHTPNLVFLFDDGSEKQSRIEQLFHKIGVDNS